MLGSILFRKIKKVNNDLSEHNRLSMPLGRFNFFLILLIFILAILSVGIHSPGQMSMDTSIQLYEAKLGQSISWNPPFMSAFLRFLGGGEVATYFFIFFNTLLTYGAFALVSSSVIKASIEANQKKIALWRVLIILILIINPIIFIYVGIVWKDVLFSSMLVAGCACILSVSDHSGPLTRAQWCLIYISVLFFSCAFFVRQQGILMTPILICSSIYVVYKGAKNKKIQIALLIAIFMTSLVLVDRWISDTIKGGNNKSSSQGYRSIMIFDIAGIITELGSSSGCLDTDMNLEQKYHIRKNYHPSRIDYLALEPIALSWFVDKTNGELFSSWASCIEKNPIAYFRHRYNSIAILYGLKGVQFTLPLHIGIDGNVEYLKSVGISPSRGNRAILVYEIGTPFTGLLFRHIFWLIIILALVISWFVRRSIFKTDMVIAFSCVILYLAYIPTMISSDFRYLYPAIPLISILCIRWLVQGVQVKKLL
jgi:hypothetical protein